MKTIVLFVLTIGFVINLFANIPNNLSQIVDSEILPIILPNEIIPIFQQPGPYCAGSVISDLPTVSINGIVGTWSPAINNTKTTTYTFTPNPGQSAVCITMDIVIEDEVVPIFALFGDAYCKGSDIQEALPSVSLNGVRGSWSPAIDNKQTTTYTFTPDAGQCAKMITRTIEIAGLIKPAFNAPSPVCQGSNPPSLPSVAENGIIGTWLPKVISTDLPGRFVYTFTPDPGQCADSTMIHVSIGEKLHIQFEKIDTLCVNSIAVLPLVSKEGVTGTWFPSSTIDTHLPDIFSYRFVPDDGSCAHEYTMEVVVNPPITVMINYEPIKSFGETTEVTVSATGGSGIYTSGVGAYNLHSGYYTFIVKDDKGCKAEGAVYLKDPQKLNVSAIVKENMKCSGETERVEIHVSGGIKPYHYSFKGGDPSSIQIIDSIFLLRAAASPYIFEVMDKNGLYGSADPLFVNNIPALQAPSVIVSQVTVGNMTLGTIKVINPLPSQGITYILTPLSPVTEQVTNTIGIFEGLSPGAIYSIGVSNLSGCVSPLSQVSIPWVTSIDIDPSMPGLKIYPNPTSGIIKIEGLSLHKSNAISLNTMDGKLIQNKTSNSVNKILDISKQKAGLYLLNINGQTFKIIKE